MLGLTGGSTIASRMPSAKCVREDKGRPALGVGFMALWLETSTGGLVPFFYYQLRRHQTQWVDDSVTASQIESSVAVAAGTRRTPAMRAMRRRGTPGGSKKHWKPWPGLPSHQLMGCSDAVVLRINYLTSRESAKMETVAGLGLIRPLQALAATQPSMYINWHLPRVQ